MTARETPDDDDRTAEDAGTDAAPVSPTDDPRTPETTDDEDKPVDNPSG
jgi:hypothetical protein